LFEMEVPEIFKGTVEIKAIAREPGFRSKVAVYSRQEGIDPVGACVGLRGIRIQNIVNELNGERIDVVQWDPDPAKFVSNALSPAQVLSVQVLPDGMTGEVVVGDRQLSLAIGKEGQNARLAAKLTGAKIDIQPDSILEES
jgi:N utilization substance protein A